MEDLYCKNCKEVTEHTEILEELHVCSICGCEKHGKINPIKTDSRKRLISNGARENIMAKHKKLTTEQINALLEDMDNRTDLGLSVKDIAKKYGVDKSGVYYHFTNRNKKKKKPGPKAGEKYKVKKKKYGKSLEFTPGNNLPIIEDKNIPKGGFYGLKKSDLDIQLGNIVGIEIPLKEKLRETIREIVLEEIGKLF